MNLQSATTPAKAGDAAGERPVALEAKATHDPSESLPPAETGTGGFIEGFRTDLLGELEAMARHLLSGGGQCDAETVAVFRRIEAGETPPIDELTLAHANLSALIAPATPRAVRSLQEGASSRGWKVLLGPSPPIRRLTTANFLFALLFFGLSLSAYVNQETISLSIYDQAGVGLFMKLIFLMAAAGLGASFGALFEVWQEINEGRFDPLTESAHWMRIGLGLVAGLVLSEVVGTEAGPGTLGDGLVMAEPLLAMAGGFSAGLLHLVVTRVVSAIENTFQPSQGRSGGTAAAAQPLPSRPSADLTASKKTPATREAVEGSE